jgi:hypothetical protein
MEDVMPTTRDFYYADMDEHNVEIFDQIIAIARGWA